MNGMMVHASPKSKTITLLLCLFLGMIGIHNFYVGRKVRGIVFIVTGGFFTVGVLWDLLMILLNRFKDVDGNIVIVN